MSHLKVVPPAEPSPEQAVTERIKKMPMLPGVIQCSRCGGRSVMTVVHSSWIDQQGKYHRGTMCEDRICYDCDRKGFWTPMILEGPREVKPRKPRKTKPKAVK